MIKDRIIRGSALVLIALAVFHGNSAKGEDDWDYEEPIQNQPGGMVFHQHQQMTEQNIERRIYGQYRSKSGFQKRLDSLLKLHVESIGLVTPLSDAQKTKLRLAGHGDMKEFFHEADKIMKKCLALKSDPQGMNKLWPIIQPLQLKMRSEFFDDDSLLHKIVKRTLDAEQAEIFEKNELERRKFRHQATIKLVVAMLENGVPLRNQQRQNFIKILSEDIPPPKKFGRYDRYYIYLQAGRAKDKLKPIFDDAQWKVLSNLFRQGERMEANLKTQGVLP